MARVNYTPEQSVMKMTGQEFLTEYEKLCLTVLAEVIQKVYLLISLTQIGDNIEALRPLGIPGEQAKFRNFLRKIKGVIYRF